MRYKKIPAILVLGVFVIGQTLYAADEKDFYESLIEDKPSESNFAPASASPSPSPVASVVPSGAVETPKPIIMQDIKSQESSPAQPKVEPKIQNEKLSDLPTPLVQASPASSVQPSIPPGTIQEVRDIKWPAKENSKPEPMTIFQSTSQVLRFDHPLARVAVSDSSICDVTTLSPQEVLIYCPKAGRVDVLVWNTDYEIAIYDIQSVIDYKKIQEILNHVDPKGEFKVVPYLDSVTVYGNASAVEKIKKIEAVLKAVSPKATSYVQVRNPKQILLEVRFAEVDRRAASEFGLDGEFISRYINFRSFTGEVSPGTTDAGGTFSPLNGGGSVSTLDIPGPSTSTQFFRYQDRAYRAAGFLDWLVTKNILKLTVHPNLLALDGEEASFVVGGESPYLTATTTSVNVQFKEFGTKLTFKPTVLDNKKVRLDMKAEVSELDFSSTVSLQGTTVPTVVKNTHKTIAQLADNEVLMVGGLVNQRINKVDKKLPILGDIPGLKKLFNRVEFDRKDVEILIMITPHIVEPFENPIKKEMYPSKESMEATSVYTPAYPDLQGDMINRLLVQDERYHDFDGMPVKRTKEIQDQFVNIKERESIMEMTLHAVMEKPLQEKVDQDSKASTKTVSTP